MTKRTKAEKFTIEEIHRGKIFLADYNPRTISAANKKRLKKSLKENGLVEPLVWNRRSGHLVSGHQRLAIIDDAEKTSDYTLSVAVIDVDETAEKKLNVQLNNPGLAGDFDLDAILRLQSDIGVEFADLGFTDFDVKMLLGETEKPKRPDAPEVEATKNTLAEIKAERQATGERLDRIGRHDVDFFVSFVFRSDDEKAAFMERIGVPAYESYVSADVLLPLLKDGR